MSDKLYVVRLPDDHPGAPGRYEVDEPRGPSFKQGGTRVAGPFPNDVDGFTEANQVAQALQEKGPGDAAYLYVNRPPSIGCQPDGFYPDLREVWMPGRQVGNRHFLGRVVYPKPLPFDDILRYELWPENIVTRAEMVFWREGSATSWLRTEYLTAEEALLREHLDRDPKAWAALVLRGLLDE